MPQNGSLWGSVVVTGEDSELGISVRGCIAVICHAQFISFHAACRISQLAIPVATSAQALSSSEELVIVVGEHVKLVASFSSRDEAISGCDKALRT